ncbi:unnamed protein product [Zymoseptoria tritici ST99CH_3D1]|nr:unnamed protein product [Zymoseptoria tritici ST99CH_3D1]
MIYLSSDIDLLIRQVLPLSDRQLFVRSTSQPRLEVIQISPPVLTATPDGTLQLTDGSDNFTPVVGPDSTSSCQEVLVDYSFAASYGRPYVGSYTPPACSFNRVTWNLTVVSAGKQFDRLGTVSLGDIELFRTSTAEPTPNGIEWHYLKDMTSFLPLFKEDQSLIFDLGNIIDDVYTAPFNVTLTASYFTIKNPSSVPADLIVPVSKRLGATGHPSYFLYPNETASNDLTLPRNVKRAVFSIAATGQAEEEFWWSNVLQSDVDVYGSDAPLYGYSPFREVQLLIDDQLAGVAWPFPVIFTGGVVPGLWRPIVGIEAFDLREDEIDITPWLPLLCDGNSHTFKIVVTGLNDDGKGQASLSHTTGNYWYVSGKVFIWLDEEGHVTSGKAPTIAGPEPTFQVSSVRSQLRNGTNDTLDYSVQAQRVLSIQSTIELSSGVELATWEQDLSFSLQGNYTDQGAVQVTTQWTNGHDKSSSGYARHYQYPLYAQNSFVEEKDNNFTLKATIERGLNLKLYTPTVFPTGLDDFDAVSQSHSEYTGAWLSTTQKGQATYLANTTSKKSFTFGTTEQELRLSGIKKPLDLFVIELDTASEELYYRHAVAVNGSIVEDSGRVLGQSAWAQQGEVTSDLGVDLCLSGVPGRGGLIGGLVDIEFDTDGGN